MTKAKIRTAVLISGRGSNLGALLSATASPGFAAGIALVVSNRADAPGLALAHENAIPVAAIDEKQCETKADMERQFDAALREAEIELICLAGFMRLLSPHFVEAWHDRILNIHPSLLPLFPGLNTHQRALDAGMRLHGATVHVVRAEMDAGPIIAQGAVPVLEGDTAETLGARVLRVEHRLYPLALDLFASGKANVVDGRATIDGATIDPGAALLSPPD